MPGDELIGMDDAERAEVHKHGQFGRLHGEFLFPPFSVMDVNEGRWRARKQQWIASGMVGELGRKDGVYSGGFESSDYMLKNYGRKASTSVSVFDPVLTELLVLWYSLPGDVIYDPFAGGVPRGVVASTLGREYIGMELRDKQVQANYANLEVIKANGWRLGDKEPKWYVGDSTNPNKVSDVMVAHRIAHTFAAGGAQGDKVDMILTCPPYGDLEKYSNAPDDLSNMPYNAFLEKYADALEHAVDCLRDDAFLAIVVGEFRDKAHNFRNFVGDTVNIIKRMGLLYYNESVLISPRGTAAIRAGSFDLSRKLVRHHQNVLVFLKGDNGKRAAARLGKPKPILDLGGMLSGEETLFE